MNERRIDVGDLVRRRNTRTTWVGIVVETSTKPYSSWIEVLVNGELRIFPIGDMVKVER